MVSIERQAPTSRLFTVVIVRSWWTVALFLLFFFLFDRGMQIKESERQHLLQKIETLELKRVDLAEQKELYARRLESEDDWRYMTLVLKERLGVKEKNEVRIPLCSSQ